MKRDTRRGKPTKEEMRYLKMHADKLPTQLKLITHTNKFNGQGLVNDGIFVDPDFDYHQRVLVAEPVNHLEKMKDLLTGCGPSAVGAYMAALKEKLKSGELRRENERIIQAVAVDAEEKRLEREALHRKNNPGLLARIIKFIKSKIK